MWYLDLFLTSGTFSYSSTMLEVLSAVTGELIAVFEHEELADASIKGLKQRLAQTLGITRFRIRLLHDSCPLGDDQTLIEDQEFTLQVVQLVMLEFLQPDREQDRGIIAACEENDDKFLEQHLNQPRNPNFEDADAMTPLCAASLNGSLKCVSLLIEAGASKDQGTTDNGATPLFMAAQEGHVEVVRFLVESGANSRALVFVGTGLNQKSDNFKVPILSRYEQRRWSIFCHGLVFVGTGLHQKLDNFKVPPASSNVKRCFTMICGALVFVGTGLKQKSDNFKVPILSRYEQRRWSIFCHGLVFVGTGLHQKLDNFKVPPASSNVKRCCTMICGALVFVGTGLNQKSDNFKAPPLSSNVKRCCTMSCGALVFVGTGLNQKLDNFKMPLASSNE